MCITNQIDMLIFTNDHHSNQDTLVCVCHFVIESFSDPILTNLVKNPINTKGCPEEGIVSSV